MINIKLFLDKITEIAKQASATKATENKIIAVFGWTGSGKSTSINILMKKKVIINKVDGIICLDISPDETACVEIGHDIENSCSLYPTLVDNAEGNYAFYDTAGIMDDRGKNDVTTSVIAACSLPILVNNASIHGIFVVIPKDYLDRTGKESLTEQIANINRLVNLEHDKVKKKVFFLITKTVELGTLKVIDDQVAANPQLSQAYAPLKRDIINTSINDTRARLGKIKNNEVITKLLDSSKHGNAFILRGDSEDDRQLLFTRLTRCKLVRSHDAPKLKLLDNIDTGAAYVRWKNELHYLNKFEGTASKIECTPETLTRFDKLVRIELLSENDAVRDLTNDELKRITRLSQHDHLNSIMRPIPADAFPLHNPVTLQTGFTDLLTLINNIAIDKSLIQYNEIDKLRTELAAMANAYNLLTTKTIHLPDPDILTGKKIQNAVLQLIAAYNKSGDRNFPAGLKSISNYLKGLATLIGKSCSESEDLREFITVLVDALNNLVSLPREVTMSHDDQKKFSKSAVKRLPTLTSDQQKLIEAIYDKKDVDEIYWQDFLQAFHFVQQNPDAKFSKSLVKECSRTQDLQNYLNTLSEFSHDAVDDASIANLTPFLLALSKEYKSALHSPLKLPAYSLVNDLPLLSDCLHAMVLLEENSERKTTNCHLPLLAAIKDNMDDYKKNLDEFIKDPATIFNRLFDDYYALLATIKRTQDAYITAYQNNARGVNLMAGPAPYIQAQTGGNPVAALNIPGGGSLNPFVNGRLDAAFLAAEKLNIASFTVGAPSAPTYNFGELVLEGRDFIQEVSPVDQTRGDQLVAGSILGQNFFERTNAIWNRSVPLSMFNQRVYDVNVFKNYEHFKVKAQFYRYYRLGRGNSEGSSPNDAGNFLCDFGQYNERRKEPWIVYANSAHGDAEVYYYFERNPDYDQQTNTVRQALSQAVRDYVDVQFTQNANQTFNWCHGGQAIPLSNLSSAATLVGQPVIATARNAIDNWFKNHRQTIASNLTNHTADPSTTAAQPKLTERQTALLNLDITVALIKLFAKLLGKDVNDTFFSNLVTASTIQGEIAGIATLTRTDVSPSLSQALAGNRTNHQAILTIPDDFNQRYLHPRMLLKRVSEKLKLHIDWYTIRYDFPDLSLDKPSNEIALVSFLRELPKDASQLTVQNINLTPLDEALLLITIGNRIGSLATLQLRNLNLTDIGGILQNCMNITELNIAHNPLNADALADLAIFLACNPALTKLTISAHPAEPITITSEQALDWLTALYLNRNLRKFEYENFVCKDHIILSAIDCIMAFKRTHTQSTDNLADDEYFKLLDQTLEVFLKDHPHPFSELDSRDNLFREGDAKNELLRTRIAKLQVVASERGKHFKKAAINSSTQPKASSPTRRAKTSSQPGSPKKDSPQTSPTSGRNSARFFYSKSDWRSQWYETDDMQKLLTASLQDQPVHIMAPLPGLELNGEFLVDSIQGHLREEGKQNSVRKDRLVWPINLNNNHWVALYINIADQTNPTIFYVDPFGRPMPDIMDKAIRRAFPAIKAENIISSPVCLQDDGYNCGPWVIEILKSLVFTDALPGKLDMNKVRGEHGDILRGLVNVSSTSKLDTQDVQLSKTL